MKTQKILLIAASLVLFSACGTAEKKTAEAPVEEKPAEHVLHHVEMAVEDYGVVEIELDETEAPITTANFLELCNEHFYDGLTFHRIMDGFMIQGGAAKDGAQPDPIVGEFSSNGYENNISHVPGVISMARTEVKDSATSQFFIVVGEATYLDGNYAAFGHVTDGMEVVQTIAAEAKPIDNNGTIVPDEQPVIEYIKVLD